MSGASLADEVGISVMGSGEASVKPNRLEIDLKANASAELTGDAVVKYRDSVRRAKEAFEKLKIERLSIDDRGLNVASSIGGDQNGYQIAIRNGQQPATKNEVGISKALRLSITGIDKLSEEEIVTLVAKLLDTAKDAGVATGSDSRSAMAARFGVSMPNSMVTFVADDASAAMKKASEAAFQDAKQNATRLADLAGVKLGPVLWVEDTSNGASKDKSMQERLVSMVYGMGTGDLEDSRLSAPTLVEIPVKVSVRVRFAIQSPSGGSK